MHNESFDVMMEETQVDSLLDEEIDRDLERLQLTEDTLGGLEGVV